MGVNVTTRTVWFAVCQECTRERIRAGIPDGSVLVAALAQPSEKERSVWLARHILVNPGHLESDLIMWSVTAGDPVA